MKRLISKMVLAALFCGSLTGLAFAQYGSVRGHVKDAEGAPVVGADIVWKNNDDGRTYKLKTDKRGDFFSLGVEPGNYVVTLSKDGKVLDEEKGLHVGLEELTHDIDLKQAQQQTVAETAKKQGKSTAEVQQQMKAQQAETAKTKQFNENVKVVNEKLNAAAELMKAKNYQQAVAAYQEAANMMPDQDLVWFRLGTAYLESAQAQTTPDERTKQFTEAYNDIHKAVDMRKAAPAEADAAKAQKDKERLAAYYDSLGVAAARTGKVDEAVADYQQAVDLDPAGAARHYFNLGIILHNSAKDMDGKKKAVEAFDKAIAADPTKADAYFYKGSDLFGLSTTDNDGKMVPPAGTTEALQKYLELQPAGPHAEEAKAMLQMAGSTVQSSYGTRKPTKK